MSGSPADFVAQTLVGFSTIGFIIFFGTAAFIPTVLELTVLRKNETDLLLLYPYRLISRLGETWSIFFIMCISVLFVITGGLSLFYLFDNVDMIINGAKLSISITLIFVFLYMIGMILYAIPIKKKEISQIIEYSSFGHGKKEFEKTDETISETPEEMNSNSSKSKTPKKKK